MRPDSYLTSLTNIFREIRYRIYPRKVNDAGRRLETKFAIEGLLSAVVLHLATVYTAMFATRLGATAGHIGLISSLPQMFAMIVLLPGAMLAGRMSNVRRPVEISLVLAGFFYGMAGLAPFLGIYDIWFLIVMISLANAPLALYNVSWQNYFSDIVPPGQRNSIYTLRMSMTFIAGIVVVQIVGIVLGRAADEKTRILLYQICYWLAFLISLLQLRVLRSSPVAITEQKGRGFHDLAAAIKTILGSKPFRKFFAVSLLFHSGWYLAWPLFFLTQVHYLGADEAWLGYIVVAPGLVQWLTIKPWGKFIEKYGVRLALVIGCMGLAINPVFSILSAYLPAGLRLPVFLAFALINAATFGAFMLSALQALLEVIPQQYKQLNLSLYTTFLLLANTVMPLTGVQLYRALGETLGSMTIMMAASSAVRLTGALLFLLRWYKMRGEPDCGKRV